MTDLILPQGAKEKLVLPPNYRKNLDDLKDKIPGDKEKMSQEKIDYWHDRIMKLVIKAKELTVEANKYLDFIGDKDRLDVVLVKEEDQKGKNEAKKFVKKSA